VSTSRRLSGRQALTAWPERLADVKAEPSDEGLQRLCSLVDVIDRWVVERWDAPGHEDRMASLAACRADAREANRLVSDVLRAKQAARGAKNLAQGRSTSRSTVPRASATPPTGEDSGQGPTSGVSVPSEATP
jgi:hypothetical protein